MLQIKLVNANMEAVTTAYILPMSPMPDIVLWGLRIFELIDPGTEIVYRECFGVTCYTQTELEAMGFRV